MSLSGHTPGEQLWQAYPVGSGSPAGQPGARGGGVQVPTPWGHALHGAWWQGCGGYPGPWTDT